MKPNKIKELDSIYKEVGEKIRITRKEHSKLTQQQIANAIGLNRTSIAKIEAGDQRFALDTLYMIASVLDVPPTSLLPDIKKKRKYMGNDKTILETATSPEGLKSKEIESILKAITESRLK